MILMRVKIQRMLEWCDVLVIGPGWEQVHRAESVLSGFCRRAAMCEKSVVLDADGLNLLALHEDWKCFIGENVIVHAAYWRDEPPVWKKYW